MRLILMRCLDTVLLEIVVTFIVLQAVPSHSRSQAFWTAVFLSSCGVHILILIALIWTT